MRGNLSIDPPQQRDRIHDYSYLDMPHSDLMSRYAPCQLSPSASPNFSDFVTFTEARGLEQRTEELIFENVYERKGDLGDGQNISEVRQVVKEEFDIKNKIDEFQLIKQLEKEKQAPVY